MMVVINIHECCVVHVPVILLLSIVRCIVRLHVQVTGYLQFNLHELAAPCQFESDLCLVVFLPP